MLHAAGVNSKVSMPSWMPEWLAENELFSAGCGLVGVGAGVALLRNGASRGVVASRRLFLSSLEIPSTDHSYQWVMQWLISKGHLNRHLGLKTSLSNDTKNAGRHSVTSFDYIPSTGRHYVRYRNRFVILERSRAATMVDFQSGSPWETVTLTTFVWDRNIFKDLLNDAREHALYREEGKTLIYKSFGQEWRQFGLPKLIRPFESVVLDEGIAEKLRDDLFEFLRSSDWYFQRGIPYRRGYLLHGPPGCGKTSLVLALAGTLQYNICILNVGDPVMTDDRLHFLLATVPPRTIVLLEDIDGAITHSESTGAAGTSAPAFENPYGNRRVTFSGLLNALDGVVATEERLIFMTTNHLDRLPASLVRPGRIDLKIRVNYATAYQMRKMFLRFFAGHNQQADEFTKILHGVPMSVAELQGFFLFAKESTDLALAMARKWQHSEAAAAEAERAQNSKNDQNPQVTIPTS